MVLPISFICFLFLFFLPSLSSSSDSLHVQQGGQEKTKKRTVPTASGSGLETQILNGVSAVAEIEKKKILRPGRKTMMSDYEHSVQEDSSRNNGEAHCSSGMINCIHEGKGIMNVKRKLNRRLGQSSGHVRMSGFVSLNADYHVPRPHPPKNN